MVSDGHPHFQQADAGPSTVEIDHQTSIGRKRERAHEMMDGWVVACISSTVFHLYVDNLDVLYAVVHCTSRSV